MATVHLEQRFPAPVDAAFAALTDHVAFGRALGAHVRLERAGTPAPNGLGAIRAVRARGVTIREEVVRWEAPRAMDYRVIGSRLITNHLGELRLAPDGAGTRLDYRIRFDIPWYFGGPLAAAALARALRREIGAGLARIAAGLRAAA